MTQKALSQLDVDLLLESITSEKAIKELERFFEQSPKLQRLRDYARNQGIKFGVTRANTPIRLSNEIGKGTVVQASFLAILAFSKRGILKEKIILIPEIFVSKIIFLRPKRRWLGITVFALAHEIAHIETLLENSEIKCEFDSAGCLYKENMADARVRKVLRANKIKMKKEIFTGYVKSGIKNVPAYKICQEKIEAGLCPLKK